MNHPFYQTAAAAEFAKRAVNEAQKRKTSARQLETKSARRRLLTLCNAMCFQHIEGEPIHPDQWQQLSDILDIINADT